MRSPNTKGIDNLQTQAKSTLKKMDVKQGRSAQKMVKMAEDGELISEEEIGTELTEVGASRLPQAAVSLEAVELAGGGAAAQARSISIGISSQVAPAAERAVATGSSTVGMTAEEAVAFRTEQIAAYAAAEDISMEAATMAAEAGEIDGVAALEAGAIGAVEVAAEASALDAAVAGALMVASVIA